MSSTVSQTGLRIAPRPEEASHSQGRRAARQHLRLEAQGQSHVWMQLEKTGPGLKAKTDGQKHRHPFCHLSTLLMRPH